LLKIGAADEPMANFISAFLPEWGVLEETGKGETIV
jgi:hypothetical protein